MILSGTKNVVRSESSISISQIRIFNKSVFYAIDHFEQSSRISKREPFASDSISLELAQLWLFLFCTIIDCLAYEQKATNEIVPSALTKFTTHHCDVHQTFQTVTLVVWTFFYASCCRRCIRTHTYIQTTEKNTVTKAYTTFLRN